MYLGAAKADIWRYAVLWCYGGAYIDDDRYIHAGKGISSVGASGVYEHDLM